MFSVPVFALISALCRITLTFETVEPTALATRPDYRCFFAGVIPRGFKSSNAVVFPTSLQGVGALSELM